MNAWLRDIFRDRPWWMNVLMVFCAYMTFFYVPWDLFAKPVHRDEEVWFGILFEGWAAKVLAIPHWFVYAAGLYGFRRMRPWVRPWGTAYVGQVAIGMWVWSGLRIGGALGWGIGLVVALPFALLAAALWNAREVFDRERTVLGDSCGGWGLVTGASSGIGAAFARALARDGCPVVLTARRGDRLQALASELERDFGVQTRVVEVDLATPDGADRLADQVADLEIGVLVNNAGVGLAGRFENLEPEALRDQVLLNCLAPTLLSRRLLPGMRQRGRGAVIFTGSVAGHQPLPLHGTYAATKAFDLFLGEALWVEMRDAGIDVLVLEPGTTDTEFQQVAGEVPHAGVSPEEIVRTALDCLGHQPSVIPGWWEWLRSNLATRLGPRDFVVSIARDIMAKRVPIEKH